MNTSNNNSPFPENEKASRIIKEMQAEANDPTLKAQAHLHIGKGYQYSNLGEAVEVAEYFQNSCIEQGRQIHALKALVNELAIKLYDENPNTCITFDIKDFAYAVD